MDTALARFGALVTPWLSAYDHVVASAMGIFEGDTAIVLGARIVLVSNPMPTDRRPLNGPLLWAREARARLTAADFDKLLEELDSGILRIGDLHAALPIPTERPSVTFVPGHHPYFRSQAVARLPTLIVSRGEFHSCLSQAIPLDELDWHLHSVTPPFADLADLHGYYSLPPLQTAGTRCAIELLAAPPVRIDPASRIEGQMAHITVLAARGVDPSQIVIGFRRFDGGLRDRVPREQFVWTETGERIEGRADLDIGDASALHCFVSYAGSGIQQWWISDPTRTLNFRHAIHSAFDPDQTILKRLLFESRKSEARAFEDGVAMLLGMLGFSVTQHGRSQKLSDAPDVVATTASGNIAVVECSVGPPDQGDQVSKLLQRSEAVRQSLANAGWPSIRVLPVVVTVLPEAEIPGQKAFAASRGAALFCLEDIQRVLDRVPYPVEADQVFGEMLEQLNASGQQGDLPFPDVR